MKVEQIDRHERKAGCRRHLKRRRNKLIRRHRGELPPVLGFAGYSG